MTFFSSGCDLSYQEPPYTVVHRSGGVEYRQYQPYLMAETTVATTADFDRAGTEGFRRLFKYIAGANTSQSKIAMTVPIQQVDTANGWRVAFMLPKQYTIVTAPAPTDSRVIVVPVAGKLTAVRRYSGRWTESNYLGNRDELVRTLDAAGVIKLSEPRLARYNAPFSRPFLRRNEVLIEVNTVPDEATHSGR
ncbi:MAG: heme-binding protein [Gammaproteobacteria bacterium]